MSRRTPLNITFALALALAGCSNDGPSSIRSRPERPPSSTLAVATAVTARGCPVCANPEHVCCEGRCVDPRNDPSNCGRCDATCSKSAPFCDGGTCITTPCETACADDETCCGTACCGSGTICCRFDGPVRTGPTCVTPTDAGTCPPGCSPLCVCAAPDTPIATPDGDRPIAELRPGDRVYSVNGGRVVAVPIVRIQRTPAVAHQVVRAVLDDGSTFEMSPAHPLGDGRTFAALRPGARLGGHLLLQVSTVPYEHAATHDILPASDTGAYFVHGVLVGSTLAPASLPRRLTP